MTEDELIKKLQEIAENRRKELPKNINVIHVYKGNISFKDALQRIIEDRLREKKIIE